VGIGFFGSKHTQDIRDAWWQQARPVQAQAHTRNATNHTAYCPAAILVFYLPSSCQRKQHQQLKKNRERLLLTPNKQHISSGPNYAHAPCRMFQQVYIGVLKKTRLLCLICHVSLHQRYMSQARGEKNKYSTTRQEHTADFPH